MNKVRQYYEDLYSTEWRSGSGPDNRFVKMWYKSFAREVLPYLSGGEALEVGCGYGYIAPTLAKRGFRYTGTDIAQSAIDQITDFRAFVAPAEQLPFEDNSFDLVLCMEVLEHVESPERAMAELFRVCRGSVVISIPTYFNAYLPLKLFADRGNQFCRNYMVWQIVDRTFLPWSLDRYISKHATITSKFAIRIAPPFSEKFEGRASMINDFFFAVEHRWGHLLPFGLHTMIVARKP